MNGHALNPILCLIFLILLSCGGGTNEVDDQSIISAKKVKGSEESNRTHEQLSKYKSEESICDVIDQKKLIEMFNISTKLNQTTHETNGNFTCDLFWDLTRETLVSKQLLMNDLKSKGKLDQAASRRLRHGSGELAISIIDLELLTNKMTPKPSVQQLFEWSKPQNIQNQDVDDLGDAAYWSPIRNAMLSIFIHDHEIVIMPKIGNTLDEDFENAIKVFKLLNL
ncbi:MAG: hypothetical protein R3E90_00450 [Marinicella sp.]|nr:hypothetical protein [Xanthomonadales bacterium]